MWPFLTNVVAQLLTVLCVPRHVHGLSDQRISNQIIKYKHKKDPDYSGPALGGIRECYILCAIALSIAVLLTDGDDRIQVVGGF